MKIIYIIFIISSFLYAKEDVEITAKEFYANSKELYSVFKGNVHIKRNLDELNASEVKVYFNKEKKPIRYEAHKNVSIYMDLKQKAKYSAKALKATFFVKKNTYKLNGNVKLIDLLNNRVLTGSTLLIDLKSGDAKVLGNERKPIKIKFSIDK